MPHNSYNGNNAKSSNYDEISMETTNYSVVPSVNHSNVSINGSNNNNNSSNNRNVHSGRQVASTKYVERERETEGEREQEKRDARRTESRKGRKLDAHLCDIFFRFTQTFT